MFSDTLDWTVEWTLRMYSQKENQQYPLMSLFSFTCKSFIEPKKSLLKKFKSFSGGNKDETRVRGKRARFRPRGGVELFVLYSVRTVGSAWGLLFYGKWVVLTLSPNSWLKSNIITCHSLAFRKMRKPLEATNLLWNKARWCWWSTHTRRVNLCSHVMAFSRVHWG